MGFSSSKAKSTTQNISETTQRELIAGEGSFVVSEGANYSAGNIGAGAIVYSDIGTEAGQVLGQGLDVVEGGIEDTFRATEKLLASTVDATAQAFSMGESALANVSESAAANSQVFSGVIKSLTENTAATQQFANQSISGFQDTVASLFRSAQSPEAENTIRLAQLGLGGLAILGVVFFVARKS
jgi:hypothetical protein